MQKPISYAIIKSMGLELIVARVFALVMMTLGLSYLVSGRHWLNFVNELKGLKSGALKVGAVMLPLSFFLVIAHPIWETPAVIITILAWLMLLKSVCMLFFPRFRLDYILTSDEKTIMLLKIGGIIVLVLSLIMIYFTFFNIPDVYNM